ncbi:MAG: Hpt domain-containing protein [Lachnospiraceae bacterium]|jgi:HPt (histidine-containing phosphotransfer) domain-containing protein|nr:Hpt domain-containing protein [Lachnospiraceae bacterium]
MSMFLEKFTAYGADVEGVMDRFMEDEDLLMMCLDQFVADDEIAQLEECMGKEDYKQAFEVAHALKGVTGNLGLTPLFQATCILVESLRHGNYDNVDEELAAVVQKREEFVKAYENMK